MLRKNPEERPNYIDIIEQIKEFYPDMKFEKPDEKPYLDPNNIP